MMEILEINSDMVPELNVGNGGYHFRVGPQPHSRINGNDFKGAPPIPHSRNCENIDLEEIT